MTQLADFCKDLTLPTMPEVAHELIRSLNDEDAPVSTIRNAFAKDPALTVKLLRLANSARYGVSREVSTLDDAMTIVGMAQVRTLALSACLSNAFPVAPGLDREAFWHESQACAGYAQWLANRIGSDGQQAWLTGFMVRLGELMIVQNSPQALPEIEREPRYPGARWERESQVLGFTEGQITAEMARRWKFPVEIVNALAASGDPLASRPFSRLSGVLHLAELLAGLESDAPQALAAIPQELLVALHLERDRLLEQLPEAREYVKVSSLH